MLVRNKQRALSIAQIFVLFAIAVKGALKLIIQISKHAKEKMDIEGFDEEQIKKAIGMGAVSRQTDGYLASYTYFKIAYKRKGDIYRIKTVLVEK